MQNSIPIKTRKILFTDYLSFILFLASVASLLLLVTSPLLLILIPLLLRRVGLIKRVLEEGTVTRGIIASKTFLRGEWIVYYVYRVAGEAYKTRNTVVAFKLPIEKGQVVEVAFDSAEPSKAFLPILYRA